MQRERGRVTSVSVRTIALIVSLGVANTALHAQECTGQPVPGARTTWYENDVHPPPDPVSATDRAAQNRFLAQIFAGLRADVEALR